MQKYYFVKKNNNNNNEGLNYSSGERNKEEGTTKGFRKPTVRT